MAETPAPPRSILIVRLSAIGDVLHALPVLDALRRAFPDARLGWIVEELSAPLLEGHPDIDKLYIVPKKQWRGAWLAKFGGEIRPFFRAVAADGWDAAVDVQGLAKSGAVAWASRAKLRVGFAGPDSREANRLFINRAVRPPAGEAVHVVEKNLSLLRGLGVEEPRGEGRLVVRDDEVEAMAEALRLAGWNGQQGLAALNPGAGWSSKRWPPECFAEAGAALARGERLAPLVFWGPGEEEARDAIAEGLRARGADPIVCPRTTLRQLAAAIRLCRLFIGGDTGPTHMAALLGVPVVAVFGSSDHRRNRPWPTERTRVLQRLDLDCCPCWKTECPLEEPRRLQCLAGVRPDEVVAAARELLAGPAGQ